jgi:ribosome-associated translation inhibitor RaiA
MNIYVNAKKVHNGCSEAMMESIQKKFRKMEKFLKEDENIKVTIEKTAKDEFKVGAFLVLKDNYHIHTSSKGGAFEEALASAADDVEDIIVRHNGKMKDRKKRRGFAEKRQTKNLVIEEAENMKEVITKVKHFECDEMTETEAIYRFEDLGHDSFVFRNANKSSLYCMLYRRGSGDGYGLIVFE